VRYLPFQETAFYHANVHT